MKISLFFLLALIFALGGELHPADSTSLSGDMSGFAGKESTSPIISAGTYVLRIYSYTGASDCYSANWHTGACSCPAGYSAWTSAFGQASNLQPSDWTLIGYDCQRYNPQ